MPKLPAANSSASSRPSLTSEPLAGQEPWPPPVPTAPKHGWKPTCVIWVPVVVFRMRSAPVSNE
jgi:hypothetical protein